ncbi:hypothetical protein FRC00_013923, partial [Tulasnella sp. 408]
VQPISFHKLFDRNVPPSLIDCVADLIRYDPERRLTAQQCKDHPYWKETENTQLTTIAIQLQAPHDRQSSSRSHHQQQPKQSEQQRQTDPTGRSYGSEPGTAATSKSAELVAGTGELDLPPPVPPLPWNAGAAPGQNGRDSAMATIASEDSHRAEDQMDISRGSLAPPLIQEQHQQHASIKQKQQPQFTSSPVQMTSPSQPSQPQQASVPPPQPQQASVPPPQPQQPPQPPPAQQSSGSKFGLGMFGKKPWFGPFKHSDAATAAAAPTRPLDPKAEKKLLAKIRQEEERAKYEARARKHRELTRAVIRKREEDIEAKCVKDPEFEWKPR